MKYGIAANKNVLTVQSVLKAEKMIPFIVAFSSTALSCSVQVRGND